jgi:quercetin dioxygenase-like cupin family protein
MTKLRGLLFVIALPVLSAAERVEIDNPQVRVRSIENAADSKSALHRHNGNRVIVYLDAGAETLTSAAGEVEKMSWKAGEVKWSPAIGLHATANAAGRPFRFVEVELKNPPSGKPVSWPRLDPVGLDPQRYPVEIDNPQVRVFRAKWGPHDKAPQHEHVVNRVLVFVTDGFVKMTAADGTVTERQYKAGDVIWGTPVTHTDENLGDKPVEAAVIDLKP